MLTGTALAEHAFVGTIRRVSVGQRVCLGDVGGPPVGVVDPDDASCVQMLASCARNAASGARVLAADVVLPDEGDLSGMAVMLDLEVFALFGGSERTTCQFAALVEQAGLDFLGVTDTSSEFSLIEARVR